MRARRPLRAEGCDYRGLRAYFLTICTEGRAKVFGSVPNVERARQQLIRTADNYQFAVIAYCFMPDHLHALVEGLEGSSDFRKFVAMFKQRSAFAHRQREGSWLWQENYHDRVLRESDRYEAIVAYMFNNPVRAGLCLSAVHYPFLGSDRFSISDLAEFVGQWNGTRP